MFRFIACVWLWVLVDITLGVQRRRRRLDMEGGVYLGNTSRSETVLFLGVKYILDLWYSMEIGSIYSLSESSTRQRCIFIFTLGTKQE